MMGHRGENPTLPQPMFGHRDENPMLETDSCSGLTDAGSCDAEAACTWCKSGARFWPRVVEGMLTCAQMHTTSRKWAFICFPADGFHSSTMSHSQQLLRCRNP